MRREITVPAFVVPGGWVIGGQSRMLDVWSPSSLVLWAPAFSYPSYRVEFTMQERVSSPARVSRRERLRRVWRRRGVHRVEPSYIYFDVRQHTTDNVAHILQNQVGVALAALDACGIADRLPDLVFVIPPSTPDFSRRLLAALGLRTLVTSDPVSGWALQMSPAKFAVRATAGRFLRAHAIEIGLLDPSEVGDLIFLSRRGRRTLSNMSDVEPMLNAAGYRTVYAEDLPPEQQIKTIATAESIFGLHGAAMGFMLFRDPSRRGAVVECFSCGFATNWARAMCAVNGDAWFGGQGDLEPRVLADMAGGAHSHRHEARNYRLDPRAVSSLLRLAAEAKACGGTPDVTRLLDTVRPEPAAS